MESQTKMENNSEQSKEYTIHMELLNTDGSSSQCDITLKTRDGGLVHVHKSLLSERCEYFEKMFYGGFKECKQNVIYIEEISYLVLAGLINFIYTGKMPEFTEENADEMLFGSELFLLNKVRKGCIDFLMDSINDDNCFIIKDIAELRTLRSLYAKCKKHVLRHFMSISHSPGFLNAKIEFVSELVDSRMLFVDQESDVYEAIIRWIKHDEENRKQYLVELIRKMKLIFILYTYQSEILHEPLVKENPECTRIIKNIHKRYSPRHGDGYLHENERLRINQLKNPYPPRRPHLPRIQCEDQNSPCYGENIIDISALLSEKLSEEFQKVEWILSMDEINFHNDWDEKWKDLKV